jgi:hypothetical protein
VLHSEELFDLYMFVAFVISCKNIRLRDLCVFVVSFSSYSFLCVFAPRPHPQPATLREALRAGALREIFLRLVTRELNI